MPSVQELIEADEAAGLATPADVAQAEREAVQAAELVDNLEERVRRGDEDVTAEEIEQRRGLSRFAQLRAEATRRKAERTARAARLRQLDALRGEIEAYAPGDGEALAKLLAKAEAAIQAFIEAMVERNEQLSVWRQRMHDLRVPEHNNPLIPPADQGYVGVNGGRVIAGRRRMDPLDPNSWVSQMLARITWGQTGTKHRQRLQVEGAAYVDDLYERLSRVDAPKDANTSHLRFFRNASGAVMAIDAHLVDAPAKGGGENHYQAQVAKGDLVEISRKEAWGR